MRHDGYEAVVIGGGPAGYVAAIRLAQLGVRTLCVEREAWGGVCLNWGCIPSKALISAATQWDRLQHAATVGISVEGARFDLAQTQAWKDGIVAQLTGGVEGLLRANGADRLLGTARLLAPDRVEVRTQEGRTVQVRAERAVVLATGARPVELPGFAVDGERILDARVAVGLTEVPERLLVIGGGVIGLELGTMYQRLGSRLTVVELSDALLPGVDRDLVRVVERRLRARGGEVLTGARATGWEARGGGVAVALRQGERATVVEADRVLVATGFRPNSEALGLDAVGVRLDARGHVAVDASYRTSVPGVYAIGDVTGPPYLAHKAFKEAEVAAEVIAGRTVGRDWYALPAAVFTDPEIATVGLSEAEARRQGREVRIGRFPFSALGRALSLQESDGFVKVVADGERVLGVGIVGPEASELIAEAALALEMVAAPEDVALTIHPHPTLSEAVMEAFKHAVGEAIHIPNRGGAAARSRAVAVAG